MKKLTILFIFIFACFGISLNAQHIEYERDIMTDEIYYSFVDSNNSSSLMVSEDGREGFIINVSFDENFGTTLTRKLTPVSLIIILHLEDVTCVEDGFMVIRFENEERIRMNNYADFNCDGKFYFSLDGEYRGLDEEQLNLLFNERIDRIMIEDGRSHRSYTHTPDNPNYFIELKQAINKSYKEVEEID